MARRYRNGHHVEPPLERLAVASNSVEFFRQGDQAGVVLPEPPAVKARLFCKAAPIDGHLFFELFDAFVGAHRPSSGKCAGPDNRKNYHASKHDHGSFHPFGHTLMRINVTHMQICRGGTAHS